MVRSGSFRGSVVDLIGGDGATAGRIFPCFDFFRYRDRD
jgi:hypothetical protein